MGDKIHNIQQIINKTEQLIQKMEEKTEQIDKKVEDMYHKLIKVDKEHERSIIMLEMDRVEYFLSFQNIEEEKEEDLTEKIAELLADALEKSKQEVLSGIDKIFRIYTSCI
uniref:Uncharacterized protein n=1 Tax=Micrurus surinamensis TaxID=129470 RepID=A0A2D4Q2A7_MICSU